MHVDPRVLFRYRAMYSKSPTTRNRDAPFGQSFDNEGLHAFLTQ